MEKILFLLLQLAVLSVKSNAIDKTELKSNNIFALGGFKFGKEETERTGRGLNLTQW